MKESKATEREQEARREWWVEETWHMHKREDLTGL